MSDLLTPADEAELAEAVAQAASARTPLEIQGGGTRPIGRPVQAETRPFPPPPCPASRCMNRAR